MNNSDGALIMKSELFDRDWYVDQYMDVGRIDMDPLHHYVWLGARLGRSPSQKFCTRSYLEAHPDVARAGINPLVHYLRRGHIENRRIFPVVAGVDRNARKMAKRILTRRHTTWDGDREADFLARLYSDDDYAERQTLVSIVMPTRNRADLIGRAIASILRQTHQCFELIVVDDGSTDGTCDVVSGFDDTRIKYVHKSESPGVSSSRNVGLSLASGEWAFFLDSDNYWRENFLETMLRFAQKESISAGYCGASIFDDSDERGKAIYADFDFESCLKENFIDLNCFFFRYVGEFREFRFNEDLRRLVDWEFIMRIACRTRVKGAPFIGVDYYDGARDRITNSTYSDVSELNDLMKTIRNTIRYELMTAPTIRDSSSYRIAVVFHVYHEDKVEECLNYLKNMDFEFDLIVTSSLDDDCESFQKIRKIFPQATFYSFPNVGADIAPFLELIPTLKGYWAVCKVHTKRDMGKWGSVWRDLLLHSVLGSKGVVNEIVERFAVNPDLKMVCSRDLYKAGLNNSIPATLIHVKTYSSTLGVEEFFGDDWGFVAGTMFWVRPDALLPLARMVCDSPGFSAAFCQDGGPEHGLERMFGLALWSDPLSQVGLVSYDDHDGKAIAEVPLGTGTSFEGLPPTFGRIVDALEDA